METEYICAMCGETFGLVRNEEWSDEKAQQEAVKEFGYYASNMVRVCDDCWNRIAPSKIASVINN